MLKLVHRRPVERVTVIQKRVEQETGVIISEQETANTENDKNINSGTEEHKRARKLPEGFEDFVVYKLSNQEPAEMETQTSLDEEWPRLS